MLSVNESVFDRAHFERAFVDFGRLPHLARCTGVRLAVCLPDIAQWLALCLYLRSQGASVAPIHPATPIEAARRVARQMKCHALLFHSVEHPEPLLDRGPDTQAVLVQLSSGTTGEPKPVERSWHSVAQEIQHYNAALGPATDMTPLLACPTTHSYGLISGVLAAFERGVQPVVMTNINPKYVIRRLLTGVRPLLYASPTLLNVIVQLLADEDILHAVMTSGAPLRSAGFSDLKRRARYVLQQYGCSEVGCIALNTDLQAATELGIPLEHLKVIAGSGSTDAQEIVVTTSGETVHTRDLGYVGERGLCFVSRIDDTINVAGVNVYPQEVEEVLLGYSGIVDVVVYKRADLHAGERVCLQFTADHDLDLNALRQWCIGQLSPYQVPLEMRQVRAIEKLENGKVNRRQLSQVSPPSPQLRY